MASVSRYRINRPRIVDEMVDGECLVIDMVTGSYYGCDGPSAFAWLTFAGGSTAEEVGDALAARFPVDATTARAEADHLLVTLIGHELMVDRGDEPPVAVAEATATYDGTTDAYTPLAIDAFTDLADIILLDPVHDVSEAGWPHKRE
jgi:hypothetical protein